MIYTELTNKAMRIAYEAHHGQYDVNGVPYIFHPYHVAEQMTDEITVCTALLHDVIEDTEVTIEQLEKEFPEEVITALRLLTHDKNTDYFEYVEKIKTNPVARAVKLADIAHNSDTSRITDKNAVSEEKRIYWEYKYSTARHILEKDKSTSSGVPENPPFSDIAELLSAVQSILGNISHIQSENIINMHENLGLKKEVIMILIGYCKQINKTYPNYIYTIACQWAKDNINTLEQAQEEVQRLMSLRDYMHQVMCIIEIERLPKTYEIIIEQWQKWGISIEMVAKVYNITLNQTGKFSFDYMNGIIKKWHEKGIKNIPPKF